jgi:hypothetical protein
MSAFAQHITFTSPLYIVMFDRGRLGFEGRTYPEDTLNSLIHEIASGQHDCIVSVIEVFEGRSYDITETVREKVEARRLEAA